MSSNMDQSSLPILDLNDLLSILGDVNSDPAPPPPPSHPIVPAGMCWCALLEAATPTFEQPMTSMAPQTHNVGPTVHHEALTLVQPGPLYSQEAFYSQGQNQPIVHHVPSATATTSPAAPPPPYINVPVAQDSIQNLSFVGYLNDGQAVYQIVPSGFPSSNPAAPPPTDVKTRKRKHHDGPYIKKPLNAFMLFSKEQRPNYVAEMNTSGSAVVNTILGQKWKSLSKDEQLKYYQQADVERRLHALLHPDWSLSHNYGAKRAKDRSKAATLAEASTLGEVTQQAEKLCVTSASTGVVEAPPTNTYVTEPSTQRSSVMETIHLYGPDRETLATVDVSSFIHLLDDYESFCLDSTTTEPTEMECLAALAELDNEDLARELAAFAFRWLFQGFLPQSRDMSFGLIGESKFLLKTIN